MPTDVASAREIGIAELDRMTRLVDDIDLLADRRRRLSSRWRRSTSPRSRRVSASSSRSSPATPGASTRSRDGQHRRRPRIACCRRGSSSPTTPRSTRPRAAPIEIGSAAGRLRRAAVGARSRRRHPARRPGIASSGASTARTASAPSAARASASRSSMRSRRATADCASSPTPPAAARPSRSTCRPPIGGAAGTGARGRRRAAARGVRMTTILIVEDEPRIAAFVSRGLESAGYDDGDRRRRRRGARRALAAATSTSCSSTSACPTIDGFEVLRELRAQGSSVPVIMLTARSSTRDTVEGLDAGANDYVPKPFTFDELLARVRSRLRETPRRQRRLGRARRRRARHPRPSRDRRTDARSSCPRASSRLPSSSCAVPAGCSAASSCSAACGAWTSTRARTSWTSTCATCAASSAPTTSSTVRGRRLPLGVTARRA